MPDFDTNIPGFNPIFQETFSQTNQTDDNKVIFVQNGQVWMTNDAETAAKVDTMSTMEALRKEILINYGESAQNYIDEGPDGGIKTLGEARAYFTKIAEEMKKQGVKTRAEVMTYIETRYGQETRKSLEALPTFKDMLNEDILGQATFVCSDILAEELIPRHYSSQKTFGNGQKPIREHLVEENTFQIAFNEASLSGGSIKDNILRNWTVTCHPQIKDVLLPLRTEHPEIADRVLDMIRPTVEGMINNLTKGTEAFTNAEMMSFKEAVNAIKTDIENENKRTAIENEMLQRYGEHIGKEAIETLNKSFPDKKTKIGDEDLDDIYREADYIFNRLEFNLTNKLNNLKTQIADTYGQEIADLMTNTLNKTLNEHIENTNPTINGDILMEQAQDLAQTTLDGIKKAFKEAKDDKTRTNLAMRWLDLTNPDLKKALDDFGDKVDANSNRFADTAFKALQPTIGAMIGFDGDITEMMHAFTEQGKTVINKTWHRAIENELRTEFGNDLGNEAIETLNRRSSEDKPVDLKILKEVKDAALFARNHVTEDASRKIAAWTQDIVNKYGQEAADLMKDTLNTVRNEHIKANMPLTMTDKPVLMEQARHLACYADIRDELIRDYGKHILQTEFTLDDKRTTLQALLDGHKTPDNPLTFDNRTMFRTIADKLVENSYAPLKDELTGLYGEDVTNRLFKSTVMGNLIGHMMDDEIRDKLLIKAGEINYIQEELDSATSIRDDFKEKMLEYCLSLDNPFPESTVHSSEWAWGNALLRKAYTMEAYAQFHERFEQYGRDAADCIKPFIDAEISRTLAEPVDVKNYDQADACTQQNIVNDKLNELNKIAPNLGKPYLAMKESFGADVAGLPLILNEIKEAARTKKTTLPQKTLNALDNIGKYAEAHGIDAGELTARICQSAERYGRIAMEMDQQEGIRTSLRESVLRSFHAIAADQELLSQASVDLNLNQNPTNDSAQWFKTDLDTGFLAESRAGINDNGNNGFTSDDLAPVSFADLYRANDVWGTTNASPLVLNGRTIPHCKENEQRSYYRAFQNQLLPKSCDPQVRRFVSFCIMQGGIPRSILGYLASVDSDHPSSISQELKMDYENMVFGHQERQFTTDGTKLHFTTNIMTRSTMGVIPGTRHDAPPLGSNYDSYLSMNTWTVDMTIDLAQKVPGKNGIPKYDVTFHPSSNNIWNLQPIQTRH